IIELVDLIEKGRGIEEDLAVALEDLPEKDAGEVEGDIQLFSDEELAFKRRGNRVAGAGTAPITHDEGNGLVAKMRITQFSLNQSLEEAVTVSVSAKPTYGSAPTWQGT
ncbi:MAG: hypothetical protein ACO3ZY_13585, partial [Phycisphaerales bacterium]